MHVANFIYLDEFLLNPASDNQVRFNHNHNHILIFSSGLKHVFTIFGGTGHIFSGLRVHPDREHLIYPLGCTVILKSLKDGKQEFLHGHTNNVSCVTVSKSGRYIASGQVTFMGFKVN